MIAPTTHRFLTILFTATISFLWLAGAHGQDIELDRARQAHELAKKRYAEGNLEAAIELVRQAYEVRSRRLGHDHPDSAASAINLGGMLVAAKDYAGAEPYLRQAVKAIENAQERDNPTYAAALRNLGACRASQSDYEEGAALMTKALGLLQEQLGKQHDRTKSLAIDLARVHVLRGDAASIAQVCESVFGVDDPETIELLHSGAMSLESNADFEQADWLYRRVYRACLRKKGPDHPDTNVVLQNLGHLNQLMGRYAQAEALLKQAVATERRLRPGTMLLANKLNNLGFLSMLVGNTERASECFDEAEEIARTQRDVRLQATLHNNRGTMAWRSGRIDEAGTAYREAYRLLGTTDASEGLKGAVLNNFAQSLLAANASADQREEAARLLTAVVERLSQTYGADDPDTLLPRAGLARIEHDRGRLERAELLWRENLRICEERLGNNHRWTGDALIDLGRYYLATNQNDAALPVLRRASAVARENLDQAYFVQSIREQRKSTTANWLVLSDYLAVSKELEDCEATYDSVLAWKGALLSHQRFTRQIEQGEARRLYHSLLEVRQKLNAALSTRTTAGRADNWEQEIHKLRRQQEELERELSRQSNAFVAAQQRQHLTSAAVSDLLPADVALVDVIMYRDCSTTPPTDRLTAFVLRNGKAVRCDLGLANEIGSLVQRWRASFGQGEAGREAGAALRAHVWEPLRPLIHHAQTVLVCPDGPLNYFPLAALPGHAPNSFLLEESRIALLPSPHLLLDIAATGAAAAPNQHAGRLLLVGMVDFDDAGSDKVPVQASTTPLLLGYRPPAQKLPGTATEIQEIRRIFQRNQGTGSDITLLQGSEASEQSVREQAASARWLHLATHGYFDTGPNHVPGWIAVGMEEAYPIPEAQCGLLLAGVNRDRPFDVDDGRWSALEVSALDLSQLELVVLSACETRLGVDQAGEGLLGLERAFHAAGARSCVATLWKVDDRATAVLMAEFYQNLWDKKLGRLESLRQAQLALLRNYDPRTKSIHGRGLMLAADHPSDNDNRLPPYYWAAFTLSGDWE